MPILVGDTSGLAQGISSAGESLAKGLEKRAERRLLGQQQQQQRGALSGALEKADLTTPEGHIQFSKDYLERGGDPSILNTVLKPYQPMLTQQARSQGATDYIKSVFDGRELPGQSLQPAPPNMDRAAVSEDNPMIADTLDLPNGQVISDEQISQLIASPYEEARRLGEDYRKTLNTKQEREYRQDADIRKEHRAEIRKIVDPYSDFTLLRDKVNRMDQVIELVEQEGTNFDDNAWRNAAIALVEDRGGASLADILKTPEQQKLFSLLRPLFGTKELGGSNPSTREMLMTLATLPSYTKSKEANRYIAQLLKGSAQEVLETAKTMRSLRDKNMTVSQFQSAVDKKLEPIREKNRKTLDVLNQMSYQAQKLAGVKPEKGRVFVFDPKGGKVLDIDEGDVKEAVSLGAIRFNAR